MSSTIQEPTSIMNIERYQTTTQTAFLLYAFHAASVLIQHHQKKKIGYKNTCILIYHVITFFLFILGFPNYNFRYQTIWSEIKG
jgi:hypothetical protein